MPSVTLLHLADYRTSQKMRSLEDPGVLCPGYGVHRDFQLLKALQLDLFAISHTQPKPMLSHHCLIS